MEYVLLLLMVVPVVVILKRYYQLFNRRNYRLNLFDGLFMGGLFFVFLPMAFSIFMGRLIMTQFSKTYSFYTVTDIDTAIYIIFSIIVIGICAVSFRTRPRQSPISSFDKNFLVIVLVLYVASELVLFITSGKANGDSHWYSANEAVFKKGIQYVLIAQIHNVGRVILPAICLYFQLKSDSKQVLRLHVLIAVIIVFVELFLTGNRIALLFVILSFLIPFLLKKKYKLIIVLVFLSFPAVKLAQFWPMVRGLIWTERFSTDHLQDVLSTAYEFKQTEDLVNNPVITATEGINIIFLNHVLEVYPEKKGFLWGETLFIKTFGTFIPRSIWEHKPEGLGTRVGAEVAPEVKGLVLNTTILGDAWANFGYFGIVFICFVLYFINKYYRRKSSELFSYLLFMISIASWRFDFSFYMISLIIVEFMIVLSRSKILVYLLQAPKRILFGVPD